MRFAEAAPTRQWHAEGLRWIAGVLHDAADSIERSQTAHYLAEEQAPGYKPVEEFLYDARFRVQNGY